MYTVWLNKHDACMWLWICTPIPQNVHMYVSQSTYIRAQKMRKSVSRMVVHDVFHLFSKCPTFLSMTWGSYTATITCWLVKILYSPCHLASPWLQKTTWTLAPVTGTAPARCHWRSCPPPEAEKVLILKLNHLISSDIISATFRDLLNFSVGVVVQFPTSPRPLLSTIQASVGLRSV